MDSVPVIPLSHSVIPRTLGGAAVSVKIRSLRLKLAPKRYFFRDFGKKT